jgi:CheY-like chemotaxis protein
MVSEQLSVLIVDDETSICDLLNEDLSGRGCRCGVAYDGKTAITKLAAADYDVALLDIRLPDISGMDVLRWMRNEGPGTEALMITAVGSIDIAVEAMKLGARDYIIKPFNLDKVYDNIRQVTSVGDGLPDGGIARMQSGRKPVPEKMEAIARGVEFRMEEMLGCSSIVTRRTIEIARQMGIEEAIIMDWAAGRLGNRQKSGNIRGMTSMAVRRSLFTDSIISATVQELRCTEVDRSEVIKVPNRGRTDDPSGAG